MFFRAFSVNRVRVPEKEAAPIRADMIHVGIPQQQLRIIGVDCDFQIRMSLFDDLQRGCQKEEIADSVERFNFNSVLSEHCAIASIMIGS